VVSAGAPEEVEGIDAILPLLEALLLRRGDHSRRVEIWRDQNETRGGVKSVRRHKTDVIGVIVRISCMNVDEKAALGRIRTKNK
jgi:hypothetical protein